jgi:hypothetical protein
MDTKDAGRIGGLSRSEKKRKASAENGKKGGRPKKLKSPDPSEAPVSLHKRNDGR